MAVTPNLNLYLSSEDDYVSNERDINDNFEKIDTGFGKTDTDVAKITDRENLSAPDRGILGNALLIDNPSYKDGWNRPWRVSANGGTIYLPSNCSWGIREVLPSTSGYLQVRITGQNTSGQSSMWTNCLANGTWTGWKEYAERFLRKIKTYTNITIGSGGYVLIDYYSQLGVSTSLYCISMNIRGWSGDLSGINLIKGSDGTSFYVSGPASKTISSITIEYFFVATVSEL